MNLLDNPLVKRLAYRATIGRFSAARELAEKYADDARSLRPWAALVVPLLIWQGRKTYQRELRAALLEQAQVKE